MLALNLSERAQMFTPHYTGPYDTVQGKFFVRLYLVYCQDSTDSWADSLGATELHRRTARTFAMLNSAFNKHDIYFVPGEANSGECHLVHTKAPNTSCPKFAQGITMHVLSDDNEGFPYARGYTYDSDLLSTSFYVQGREGNDPGSNLAVTIHEIGHCFGLAHTFANTNAGEHNGPSPSCAAPNGCQSGYGNDPDQCCGDLVGDTPKHSNSSHIKISSDCDLSETPSGVSPVIFKNYMSYSYPSRCLDQFSDQQVRRMRMYLKNSPALDTIKVPATTIPTDTTIWSTPTSKFSNIEVPSGSTLIVNDVLEMAPGTYIVVRRGGTLIVNGTVTAGCGGMWGGIVVEGAANQPQKNSNGLPSTAQGRFVLNTTGIVEHAVDGVAAREFAPQANPHLLGGGIVEVYGRIRNCTNAISLFYYQKDPKANTVSGAFLTLDNNYRGDAAKQPTLLYMQAQTRLDVLGTWFYDFRTQGCAGSASRAKGLVADESAFQVRSSLFRNLDRGVQAYGKTLGFGTYTVENTSFFTCYTDIESNLPDNFRIDDSYFHVGRPPMCPQESVDFTGVRLFGYTLPMGIVLANNSFYGGDTEDDSYVGTDCTGTGSMENFIRKNNFWDMDTGNDASGFNGGFKGLRYECNEHYDNRFANLVNEGASVRNIQGDVDLFTQNSTAAGNRFSGSGYTWYNSGAPITYYFWDTIGQVLTTGDGFFNVDTVPATFPNPNCSTYIHEDECPPPCPMEDSEIWQDSFFQHHTEWLTIKAEYDNLTDTAAQAALLPEINAHRSAMDIWGGRVIRNFALDSTGTKVDSVLAWTERLHAYEADLRLARHAFFTGDFEGYDQWLEDIPERNDLTERQSDELADFAEMLAVLRPYAETEADMHRLAATVVDSLEVWAANCDEPGFLARVLLLGNGWEATPDCGGGSLRPVKTLSVSNAGKPTVRIFPNPTTGQFFVELPQGAAPVRVLVHSLDGRTVLEQTLAASAELDGSKLPPGLYFCRVIDPTGLHLVTKLIISR